MADHASIRLVAVRNRFFEYAERVDQGGKSLKERAAKRIAKRAQALAPVRTGFMRDNIKAKQEGDEWVVEAEAFYSMFVELGTVRMGPRPFLTPAARGEFPTFQTELQKIFEEGAVTVVPIG